MAAKAVSLKSVNPDARVYGYSFGLDVLGEVALLFEMNDTLAEGIHELAEMEALFQASGYVGVVRRESDAELESSEARILIDPSIVRGLEYYTGPVYEAELTFTVTGDEGQPVRFGSVGGGGRYDGLIGRFRNEPVPATGFSIGVSRLLAALQAVKSSIVTGAEAPGPVVVLVMDRERIADYQRMVATLRAGGVRAELYLGASGMKAQMKYADRRRSPCVVIQGSDERAREEVQIKDLALGAALAAGGKDRADYLDKQAEAQFSVPEGDLLSAVRKVIGRAGR
jgi:histidyl-tRNA synthetase